MTESEFNVICKNWIKLTIDEPHRDFLKDKSDRICYISFLDQLEKGVQEASGVSSLSASLNVSKQVVRRVLTLDEGKDLLQKIKIKVGWLGYGSVNESEFE